MSSISHAKSDSVSFCRTIIYDLPAGQLQRTSSGNQRVFRAGCQTANCFYIASARLRTIERLADENIKGNVRFPPSVYEVDLIFQTMQASIASHEASMPEWVNNILLNPELAKETEQRGHHESKIVLERLKEKLASLDSAQGQGADPTQSTRQACEMLIKGVESFLKQAEFNCLHTYLLELKLRKRGEIMAKALQEMGLSLEQVAKILAENTQEPERSKLLESKDFTQLPIDLWDAPLQTYLENLYCNFFGLKPLTSSDYNLFKDIDGFINLMEQHGPFAFSGNLGTTSYLDPPKALKEKIVSRNVYGWPVNAKRRQQKFFIHCVTVIGACKLENGKGYIYFLDPADPSDPENMTAEKVYKMSFDKFMSLAISGRRADKLGHLQRCALTL